MAVIDLYNTVANALDRGEVVIGIFIDLKKAFDTLNHEILTHKLEHYGVRGILLKLLKCYLTNRKQLVEYNNIHSNLETIKIGVPQGSILGPLLFIIYINDIVNCSPTIHPILFADDTNVVLSHKNYPELINKANIELSNLSDWLVSNRLTINVQKTNYIRFRAGNKKYPAKTPPLMVNNSIIERVTEVKFLGVYIDEKLDWNAHMVQMEKKITKSIGVINRFKNILPASVLRSLYHTLVHPYLTYCNIVWGRATDTVLNKLVLLQKRALRVISTEVYLAHTAPLFTSNSILPLKEINKYQLAIFMFKYLNSAVPHSCNQFVAKALKLELSTRKLRTVREFLLPPHRLQIKKKSIMVAGPRLWETIPIPIQKANNLAVHKKMLFKHLITKLNH